MNVAGPLIKGIAEQVVDRVYDVMVIGRQFIGGFEPDVLLQVAQVNAAVPELDLRGGNGALEPEKFIDQPDHVGLGGHHDGHRHLADPAQVFDDLRVKRVGGGHHELPGFHANRQDQVFHGEIAGDGGGDQV